MNPPLKIILQNVALEDGNSIFLEIVDTAGQESYQSTIDNFLSNGDAFLIVYSIIDSSSFDYADNILERISIFRDNVPTTKGQDLADQYHGVFFETSVPHGTNIKEAFQAISLDQNIGCMLLAKSL